MIQVKELSPTVRLDRKHIWHPFTPFKIWLADDYEPIVIKSGKGSILIDDKQRRYLDGNSSIWVNLHGHRNPTIDRAIKKQLDKIAHSSFLGLTNEQAPRLAKRLTEFCRSPHFDGSGKRALSRVFFSDDGSTAIETALKIIFQYHGLKGQGQRTAFVSLGKGYHGDTVGAMSLGHSDSFHGVYKKLQFPSIEAMSPYCYRCPFNNAEPERRDARAWKRCNQECITQFQQAVESCGSRFAGTVIEPRIQGAAGMVMHPSGYLAAVSQITKRAGGKLIFDEVMTGFYRCGLPMAFHSEKCRPDALALAKGLTAGYLPLAATLVTHELVSAFIGKGDTTFYHGHSYSGNQLGCAAALANLQILNSRGFRPELAKKIVALSEAAKIFWNHPNVGDVRQMGLVLAVELVEDWRTKKAFPRSQRVGWVISEGAKANGILTRPVGDVLLVMPPLSTSIRDIRFLVKGLYKTLRKVLPAVEWDRTNG